MGFMEAKTREKIRTLIELVRQTAEGRCAVALAGAHAKGTADESSDIDIFLYAERAKPLEERRKILAAAADPGTTPYLDPDFEATPWGGSMDFQFGGTPVEVVGRTLAATDRDLQEGLAGKFEIIPATWTSNGYYTFIHLCELAFIQPVYDPDGILADYKARLDPYPPKLRKAVACTFFGRACTWLDNFHYLSAIEREDIWFCGPAVMHTVLDMVQVVFALDEVWFTGDKKLVKALSALPSCPPVLLQNAALLMSAPPDRQQLARQRALLCAARDELRGRLQAAGLL